MGYKRGQLTIFIIAGLVILIFVGMFVYFLSNSIQISQEEGDFSPLSSFVTSCIKRSSHEAGYYVSRHAGEALPGHTYTYYGENVTIVYDTTKTPKNMLLSLDEIERNYETIIKQKLIGCVNDFTEFKDMGYEITSEEPNATVEIYEDYVIADVNYNIKAKIDDKPYLYSGAPKQRIPLRIGRLHNEAKKIVERESPHIPAHIYHDLYLMNINYFSERKSGTGYWTFMLIDDLGSLKQIDNKYNNGENNVFLFGEYYE